MMRSAVKHSWTLAAVVLSFVSACSSSASDDEEGAAGAGASAGASAGGAGSGGKVSSGGSAGTTSSGGAAGISGSAGDCGCVSSPVSWQRDGGFVQYVDVHTLSACAEYTLERSGNTPMQLCSQALAADCEGSVSAGEVAAALADSDVQAALAAAPIVYGFDSRPADGQVFRIELEGAVIDVGEECGSSSSCVDIPAGVGALRTLLETLAEQESMREPCASSLP